MTLESHLAALAWQMEMGADEGLCEVPHDKRLFKQDDFVVKKQRHAPELVESLVVPEEVASPPSIPPSHSPVFSVKSTSSLLPLQSVSKLQDAARESAFRAHTLEELRAIMEAFEGCDLKKTAMNTVFSDGCSDAPVMCVGEAPGADEDRYGKPFVGQSGQLMDKMLATIGLSRKTNVYISNIVPWRPPGNRPPTPQEMAMCLPFIERHIELVQPKYLLLWGSTAVKALLGAKEAVMRLRGRSHPYHSPGLPAPIPAFVLFHPAYLLRSPGQKRIMWMDLLQFKLMMAQ